ncbi:hypothetical protein CCYN49044_250019 [Capnocytophaga cynodegmi]|uniref:Uncharacterized protein n=1 Tax=Capnocytophaga cynodegmi TaxID=28189 RepID=A0A0B7HJS4_9FLAO|nr:hypothetical protein CCYN74_110015 [Capnocytophaga cynodegmi]CEN38909.1 hypothetical protein CCYN49044_250019 [Capnocytophaga cynodegmi]
MVGKHISFLDNNSKIWHDIFCVVIREELIKVFSYDKIETYLAFGLILDYKPYVLSKRS